VYKVQVTQSQSIYHFFRHVGFSATQGWTLRVTLRVAFLIWWLAAKNIKLAGLYKRNIWDIRFMPVSILFTYFHSYIKAQAHFSLSEV
jgi:hypothetical protein